MKWFFTILALCTLCTAMDCPVQIEEARQKPSGALPNGDLKWDLAAKYKNATDKEIQSVKFNAKLFNATNDVTDDFNNYVDTRFTKPGKERKSEWDFNYWVQSGKAWNGFRLYVAKVLFSDGTEWNDDGSMSCNYHFVKDPHGLHR